MMYIVTVLSDKKGKINMKDKRLSRKERNKNKKHESEFKEQIIITLINSIATVLGTKILEIIFGRWLK